MKKAWILIALAAMAILPQSAQARPWIGFGINVGVPVYYPYYRPYYYAPPPYYAYPPPYYAYPPPIVYQPAPAPLVYQPAPRPVTPPPPPPSTNSVSTTQPAINTAYSEQATSPQLQQNRQGDLSRYMRQLGDANERVRSDSAIELGRLRATEAVDQLIGLLSSDRSPQVRETAARALGLIASPRSLQALQTSAQADNDREVRHSAQFSAEIIRANLRQN